MEKPTEVEKPTEPLITRHRRLVQCFSLLAFGALALAVLVYRPARTRRMRVGSRWRASFSHATTTPIDRMPYSGLVLSDLDVTSPRQPPDLLEPYLPPLSAYLPHLVEVGQSLQAVSLGRATIGRWWANPLALTSQSANLSRT
jgi:hypothetical protein